MTSWTSALLLGSVIACTAVRPIEPARFIPQNQPTHVSVWTSPTEVTIVTYPRISGDSLVGMVFDLPWGVPLKDILRVEARTRDPGRTAFFVAGTAVSLAGLAVLMANNSGKGGQPLTPGLNCSSDYSSSVATGLTPCDAGSK